MAKLIYEKAYKWARCSVCHKVYSASLLLYFNDCQYKPSFSFCPNCGERFEEKEGEDCPNFPKNGS